MNGRASAIAGLICALAGAAAGLVSAASQPTESKPFVIRDPETAGARRYAWIDLKGTFGEQISQTPLREAIREAAKSRADLLIIVLDAAKPAKLMPVLDAAVDNFDELLRAEQLVEVLTEELSRASDPPMRLVMWVKSAEANAAFLPLVAPRIFMHPNATIGGLEWYESVDMMHPEVPLRGTPRIVHAYGWPVAGGHDPRLVRAMVHREYVLSYGWRDGQLELFEGVPVRTGDVLLSDDGIGANADLPEERSEGCGNDYLRVTASVAEAVGLSEWVVSSQEELLARLGLDTNGAQVAPRICAILQEWAAGVKLTQRAMLGLWTEYRWVTQEEPDDEAEGRPFRARRSTVLEQMRSLWRGRYGEALGVRWRSEHHVPSLPEVTRLIDALRREEPAHRPP